MLVCAELQYTTQDVYTRKPAISDRVELHIPKYSCRRAHCLQILQHGLNEADHETDGFLISYTSIVAVALV